MNFTRFNNTKCMVLCLDVDNPTLGNMWIESSLMEKNLRMSVDERLDII